MKNSRPIEIEHCHFVYLNDFLFTWIQYQHLNIVVSII